MKCPDLKKGVLLIFEMMKKWSPTTTKTRMLCNMKQDMKSYEKTNHDNVKLCNKNVDEVEKNYIKAQKYLTMEGKLAFYWLVVLVTITTPIFSHVKDKNDMFTVCGEDMISSQEGKS